MTETTIEKLQRIIVESISSVICIDEQYIEPYLGKSNKLNRDFTKKIYEAFTKELNCRTVIYPYKADDDKWVDFLDKQDLLVVDWQLTNPLDSKRPLDIIDKAIEKHIQYVCIYTSNTGSALNEVINLVKSYYLGFSEKEVKDTATKAGLVGMEEYLIKRIVTEPIFTSRKAKDYKNKMRNEGVELGADTKGTFDHCAYKEWNKLFCKYVSNPPGFSNFSLEPDYTGDKSIVVEDTYVFFVSKVGEGDYNPKTIVETIAKELSEEPKSVFNVLWIYYFTLLRNSIYKKNNLPLRVSANALKYHAKSAIEDGGETQYFSNILGIIVDEIVECIYKGQELKPEQEIISEIKAQGSDLQYCSVAKDLMFMNALLNTNNELSVTEHELVLGDVFTAELEIGGVTKTKYFMCISALCDCRNPKCLNSLNSYSFIMGDKSDSTFDDGNPEEEILSFVIEGENAFHIDWNNTVFGGYVGKGENRVSREKVLDVYFEDKKYELKYICSIKDRYAQRVANHAFSWGLRVGTTYAKKCKSERRT